VEDAHRAAIDALRREHEAASSVLQAAVDSAAAHAADERARNEGLLARVRAQGVIPSLIACGRVALGAGETGQRTATRYLHTAEEGSRSRFESGSLRTACERICVISSVIVMLFAYGYTGVDAPVHDVLDDRFAQQGHGKQFSLFCLVLISEVQEIQLLQKSVAAWEQRHNQLRDKLSFYASDVERVRVLSLLCSDLFTLMTCVGRTPERTEQKY